VIEVERLPLAPRLDEVGDEPFWAFGEDYELLAALDPEDAEASGFAIVGRCEEGAGVELLFDGRTIGVRGWTHFQ
jgi:thiamine monophosphate kinase